ncbi:MAG: HlyD family efflux transporter periplasmic adaptor subunit [Sulfitobacter sp.]
MRITRLSVGLLIAFVAGWVAYGEFSKRGIPGAKVNARLTTLRAAAAGAVVIAPHELGARVAKDEVIATIENTTPVTAVTDGVLWTVLAGTGEAVETNQDIAQILDCDTAIVTLIVTEPVFRKRYAGEAVMFQLKGGDVFYPGMITGLAGQGADITYGNLAIRPDSFADEAFGMTLLVPALRDDPTLRCLIGRNGSVYFGKRPLDIFRGFPDSGAVQP